MDKKSPIRSPSDSGLGVQERPDETRPNPWELRFSGRHEGLERLRQWVAKNGALALTRDEAAVIACLEPHHFSKIFCQHVGKSFKEWRRDYRIVWALLALAGGTLSLAEIIHHAGYRDRRAFERSFKHLTGVTPGYYRRVREGCETELPGEAKTHFKPHIAHLKPQPRGLARESIPHMQSAVPSVVSGSEAAETSCVDDVDV